MVKKIGNMSKISFLTIVFFISINVFSQNAKSFPAFKLEGNAQGTTYSIIYVDSLARNFDKSIDSLLKVFDNSCSMYTPNSILARVNKNDTTVKIDKWFKQIFEYSHEISEKSGGAYDITVGPLVNAYGFGIKNKVPLSQHQVDSILQFVGYNKVKLVNDKVIKDDPRMVIDFNAIAQGYSLDVVAEFFDKQNLSSYLIEIGGEVVGKGKKPNGQNWIVGIEKPTDSKDEVSKLQAMVKIENCAITTAGSYRKYYEEDGQKYSHMIDPHTGKSAKNNLLSVSVIAKNGMIADGYDTAFMVMGLEKSLEFLKSHPEMEAYFIYYENGTFKIKMTPGFEQYLVKTDK